MAILKCLEALGKSFVIGHWYFTKKNDILIFLNT